MKGTLNRFVQGQSDSPRQNKNVPSVNILNTDLNLKIDRCKTAVYMNWWAGQNNCWCWDRSGGTGESELDSRCSRWRRQLWGPERFLSPVRQHGDLFPGARTVYVTAGCHLVPDVKQDKSYERPRCVNLKAVFYGLKTRAFTFTFFPYAVPHNVRN